MARGGRKLGVAVGAAVTLSLLLPAVPIAAQSSGASGSTIKIGVPYPESGFLAADYKTMGGVIDAWEEYVNKEHDGLAGHQVEVVTGDTKGDPSAALATVTEMVEEDGIIASVGGTDDLSLAAMTEYLNEQGIPSVGAICYDPTLCAGPQDSTPGYFATTTTFPTLATANVAAGKIVKAKRVGVMICSEDPACAQVEPLIEDAAKADGMKYVGLVPVGAADANFTAPCLSLKQKKADFVLLNVVAAIIPRIIGDCIKQDFNVPFAAGGTGADGATLIPTSKEISDLVMVGGLNAFPWFGKSAPIKQFRSTMKKYQPKARYDNVAATSLWAALELFRTAMENNASNLSAEPTGEDVTNAMYSLQNEDLDGLLPQPVTYTQGEGSPFIDCFWLFELEEGKFTTPDGIKPQCAAPSAEGS